MLSHFPTPYPNETFYSVLCRYYVSTGIKEVTPVKRELFGGREGANIFTLFPNRTIADIVAQLPKGLFDVRTLILEHTTFRYYTRMFDEKSCRKILRALEEGHGEIPNFIRYSFPKEKYSLRYCPLCVEEDTQTFGEPYYHVEHQIPLSSVCIRHHCRLYQIQHRKSAKQLGQSFYPLCLMDREKEADLSFMSSELQISKIVWEYWRLPLAVGPTEGHNNLYQMLLDRGLGRISRQSGIVVDRESLYSALCDYFGAEQVRQVFGDTIRGAMMNRIKRWERQLPERYVLIQAMLGLSSGMVFGEEPVDDPLLAKLRAIPTEGVFTTLKEVAGSLGLQEYEVGALFRQYGLEPFWQKMPRRKEATARAERVICHVTRGELEQIRNVALELGYRSEGPFALECVRYVMEQRSRSKDASNKVNLIGASLEEPEK